MSTRNELFAAMSTAIALRQGTVYVSEDGKTPVLHLDWIADYLLAQGWRPPMRVIETVEELEQANFPAILFGSGTYMDGKSTFQNCQFRPVPEWAGGEPGVFETLIVAGVGAPACAWAKDIQLPVKVLWEPEVKA